MKVERHVLKKISLYEIIGDIYKFSLKNNIYAILKVHDQSNPIISANSKTKTFKNITLENKTLSNRGGSRAPVTCKM